MLISTTILGWLGIFIFLIIIISFKKLITNNEFAFIHILMALMYAMWLPLPIALNHILRSEYMQIGTIFGFLYLFMLVFTMTFQAGHITFIVKNNDKKLINNKQEEYMMSTLSKPFEGLANVFKCIWTLFLAIAFWLNDEIIMAIIMSIFSLLLIYYLIIVMDTVLMKRITLISKLKANIYVTNIETITFFSTLMVYITYNI